MSCRGAVVAAGDQDMENETACFHFILFILDPLLLLQSMQHICEHITDQLKDTKLTMTSTKMRHQDRSQSFLTQLDFYIRRSCLIPHRVICEEPFKHDLNFGAQSARVTHSSV